MRWAEAGSDQPTFAQVGSLKLCINDGCWAILFKSGTDGMVMFLARSHCDGVSQYQITGRCGSPHLSKVGLVGREGAVLAVAKQEQPTFAFRFFPFPSGTQVSSPIPNPESAVKTAINVRHLPPL